MRPHLCVLHEFGEAQLQVVLHVEEEQVVGQLLGRGLQEGHQQRHNVLQAPRAAGRGRRGDRHMDGPCKAPAMSGERLLGRSSGVGGLMGARSACHAL